MQEPFEGLRRDRVDGEQVTIPRISVSRERIERWHAAARTVDTNLNTWIVSTPRHQAGCAAPALEEPRGSAGPAGGTGVHRA